MKGSGLAGSRWGERRATVVTAGIDVGAAGTQAVVMAGGEVAGCANLSEGSESLDSAQLALDLALRGAAMKASDIDYRVETGRGELSGLADRTVSELACHARAVNHLLGPSVGTVLVAGGQDCSVVHCNEEGRPLRFLMNACRPAQCREMLCNGCGAAQGSGISVVAEFLSVPIEEVGAMSLDVDEKRLAAKLSSPLDIRESIQDDMLEEIGEEILAHGGIPPLSGALGVVCAALAKSQAAGLLRNGWSKSEILAVCCASVAHQAALLVRRMGIRGRFGITGGVAKNEGVVKRLEGELGLKGVTPALDPQLTGALGAALFAMDIACRPAQVPQMGGQDILRQFPDLF